MSLYPSLTWCLKVSPNVAAPIADAVLPQGEEEALGMYSSAFRREMMVIMMKVEDLTRDYPPLPPKGKGEGEGYSSDVGGPTGGSGSKEDRKKRGKK